MAVKVSAADATANWKSRFSGSTAKYTAGVQAVKVAPGQLAAANKIGYVQGVTNSADTWAARTAAVSREQWINQTVTIGAQRLTSGADKGANKMQAFMTAFLPQLSQVVDGLPQRGGFDQNLARFDSYARALHAKKGTF